MVAEMSQKCIFIFNIFLSKKPYIFIFNQKNVRILPFKENIFIFNQNTLVFKKMLIFKWFFFRIKNIFIQSRKKMCSMKYFYSLIFGSQI